MRTFWRITAFLADYKLLVAVAFGAALGQMALSLTIPLFTRAVINDALMAGHYELRAARSAPRGQRSSLRSRSCVALRPVTNLGIEYTLRSPRNSTARACVAMLPHGVKIAVLLLHPQLVAGAALAHLPAAVLIVALRRLLHPVLRDVAEDRRRRRSPENAPARASQAFAGRTTS
jgi:hypothetical protein